MRKVLLIVLGLSLISCSKKIEENHSVSIVDNTKIQAFEGNFGCSNGSFIELIQDELGNVSFESTGQSLNTVNPKNGTFGTHPTISDRNIAVLNSSVRVSRNFNYSSSTHDIEQDISGSNITGNHRTDVVVTLIDGGIKISIKIWDGAVNGNINSVISNRSLKCY